MFTGIVEETGTIRSLSNGTIRVGCKKVIGIGTNIGDSISVNGICLTVTQIDDNSFAADVMPETIRRSSLATLNIGSPVNLERAMPAQGRFGGHIVTGHIDGIGKIRKITRERNAVWFEIDIDRELSPFIVTKGSIAIDGISLTVAETHKNGFMVSLIPHTLESTSLFQRNVGESVNLETDIIGKYVNSFFNNESVTDVTLDNELISQRSAYHN